MILHKYKCHTLVLGVGSAGIEAYKQVVEAKLTCILVDQTPLSSNYLRQIELPSRVLMEIAKIANNVALAHELGFKGCEGNISSYDDVLAKIRQIRGKSTNDTLSFIYNIPENCRFFGQAKFIDNHHLTVDDNIVIEFKTAIIATGAEPAVAYNLAKLGKVLTYSNFYEENKIPKSLAVFGGSGTGLLIAQALSYLGSKVVLFANKKLWILSDKAIEQVAKDKLSRSFEINLKSEITQIKKLADGSYQIYYLDENKFENYLAVENIFCASHPSARIGGLNLKAIGVELDLHGNIKVDEHTYQTSISNIFASGDVCSYIKGTSKSKITGKIAGINACLYPKVQAFEKEVNFALVKTDPPMAIVGRSLEELEQQVKDGLDFIIGHAKIYDIGSDQRSNYGLLHIYVNKHDYKILGAQICTKGAEGIAHFLTLAIKKNMDIFELSQFPFFHSCTESAIAMACNSVIQSLENN